MFEHYTLQQDAGVNACGAYALGALINQKQGGTPENMPRGIDIYQSIIILQQHIPMFDGSNPYSLPSSLVTIGRQYGFQDDIQVMVNHQKLKPEFRQIMERQIKTIGKQASVIQNNLSLQHMTLAAGYYLVLVDDGDHWVAMARNSHGLYIYDPAYGLSQEITEIHDDRVNALDTHYIYAGVLICF